MCDAVLLQLRWPLLFSSLVKNVRLSPLVPGPAAALQTRPSHAGFLLRSLASSSPCVCVGVSVQITQPYCPCCQFLLPFFQNPSYLPACYLFACLLIYHLLCRSDLHVVQRGGGCDCLHGWMDAAHWSVQFTSYFRLARTFSAQTAHLTFLL